MLQAVGGTGLDELVSNQVVIALVLAPAFLLAVVANLNWWKPAGLPALYSLVYLVLGATQGLPAGNVLLFVPSTRSWSVCPKS